MLPFLEQAQQKLHASKWADGAPLPQVVQRVADLARDESACAEAIGRCFIMRFLSAYPCAHCDQPLANSKLTKRLHAMP